MEESLKDRVDAFRLVFVPAPIEGELVVSHQWANTLVGDLWKEIERLRALGK